MKGWRVSDIDPINYQPGEYGQRDGFWYCRTPNGLLGNISAHGITEHEDGTITVSPSILVRQGTDPGSPSWHGFLERGEWREC
jgi:hypothetical protein